MTKGVVLAALAAAISIFFVSQTAANAQYPPPKGSLICAYASSRITINSSINLAVTLRDTYGNIMVGQRVNFYISSSNGSAYLSTSESWTDAGGAAYVSVVVGANAGNVSVSASSDGVSCNAALQIFSPPAPPPSQPVPVVEVLSIVSPPRTGDAGLVGRDSGNAYLMLGVEAGALLLVVLGLGLVRRDNETVRAELD